MPAQALRPGLLTSLAAAYTPDELRSLLDATHLKAAAIHAGAISLEILGTKP